MLLPAKNVIKQNALIANLIMDFTATNTSSDKTKCSACPENCSRCEVNSTCI